MENLGLNDIREMFLKFFESKQHLRLPSASLVPKGDNSLLLINSGMAPLKPYFTGAAEPPSKRVVTCQKCIRTPDIERVGKTARHGTFFEMLGNFSFGDYFKKEAIAYSWEFVTQVMKIDVSCLWVSVYLEDDETADIWVNDVGVAPERIVRLGKEDNFWEHGTGPCGPCSEIYYDRGESAGCGSENCAVGCDCDRFVEFWNLVFTQFDKDSEGNYSKLASPNIDTGMGLERLAAIMQGVNNLFEVDTVVNILRRVSEIAGVTYGADEKSDISLRVIADHIRSTVFMLCDGVMPSNEGRGYVLRRLLRRAALHGRLLGIRGSFLEDIAAIVVQNSAGAYPELNEKKDYIARLIKIEEERFEQTIDQGLSLLSQQIEKMKRGDLLGGDLAFKFYDTHGFPLDLMREILAEQGISIDEKKFHEFLAEQRARARGAREQESSWEGGKNAGGDSPETEFMGYEHLECLSVVVDISGDENNATIVLDKTPFYAESGGQVGDRGVICGRNGQILVEKCIAKDGVTLHVGKLNGSIEAGEEVKASVDQDERRATERNHSATHLLQAALREHLGSHIEQKGSMVSADKLRFDFAHYEAVEPKILREVEATVNRMIFQALPVNIQYMPIADAQKMGATALFGEKYGDIVRVVKMGDYSTELCGGCHVDSTSKIGLFTIVSETGIAAGIRRIEALTAMGIIDALEKARGYAQNLEEKAKEQQKELVKNYSNQIEALTDKLASKEMDELMAKVKNIGDISVIAARLDGFDAGALRAMCDKARDRLDAGLITLIGVFDGKISTVAAATKKAVEKGVHCGEILKRVSAIIGGSGGGRPDMAQGGGKDAGKIDEALKTVYNTEK